ncbi:hypothetical protein CHU_3262 [Cytophaga hutchinsonii ATCC 33406]|uniref:Uncharacterized protein n=1 Tax=Cytophaga hutchinsonii (strain ATCC 33406 / DSM 1761 / CIP 103989 / NBRC 15051 / NCIMB 9469 / D465) TaxID=269798 RepID=A0A6N4SVD0_CYTH3|nr:hypothetical protein CHU_3262 [Cytophaga hutchinsonii ATCC 33406]
MAMFSMPVGRVKERNPLGHSGQRRLQDVVGSIAMEYGTEGCTTLPVIFEY